MEDNEILPNETTFFMHRDEYDLYIGCIINGKDIYFHPITSTSENGVTTHGLSIGHLIFNCNPDELKKVEEVFYAKFSILLAYYQLIVDTDSGYPIPLHVLQNALSLPLTPEEERVFLDAINEYTNIYLIKDTRTGYIKIGRSNEPTTRLRQLIKQDTLLPNANEFRLIIAWAALPYIEKVLHNKYEQKRVRGEWFELTQQDVDDIINSFVKE